MRSRGSRSTLGQLQKRLGEMEQRARTEFPHKETLARLETWISDVRHDVADSEKRSREDISQLAKFMRELGSRVDTTERSVAQTNGASKSVDGRRRGAARCARSALGIDVRRDARRSCRRSTGGLRKVRNAKGGIQQEAFNALKKSVDSLGERVEESFTRLSRAGVQTEAFTSLKRSVESLYERVEQNTSASKGGVQSGSVRGAEAVCRYAVDTFDGLTERLDLVSDPSVGPLASPLSAIGSTLEALTVKIEDSERRAAELVSTVSSALKTISTRLDETDKKHTQSFQTITRRLDDSRSRRGRVGAFGRRFAQGADAAPRRVGQEAQGSDRRLEADRRRIGREGRGRSHSARFLCAAPLRAAVGAEFAAAFVYAAVDTPTPPSSFTRLRRRR